MDQFSKLFWRTDDGSRETMRQSAGGGQALVDGSPMVVRGPRRLSGEWVRFVHRIMPPTPVVGLRAVNATGSIRFAPSECHPGNVVGLGMSAWECRPLEARTGKGGGPRGPKGAQSARPVQIPASLTAAFIAACSRHPVACLIGADRRSDRTLTQINAGVASMGLSYGSCDGAALASRLMRRRAYRTGVWHMRTDDFRPSENVEDDREASASRGIPGGRGGLG